MTSCRDSRPHSGTTCSGSPLKVLPKKLKTNPAEIVLRLGMTSAGCNWLIARWQMLGGKLETGVAWGDEDKSLAYDLLGIGPNSG